MFPWSVPEKVVECPRDGFGVPGRWWSVPGKEVQCPRERVGGGVFQGGCGVSQGRGFMYLHGVSQGGVWGFGVLWGAVHTAT